MDQIRELIIEILNQTKFYLLLDDAYVNLFKVLNPVHFDRDCWLELEEKFPNFVKPEDHTVLLEELDIPEG